MATSVNYERMGNGDSSKSWALRFFLLAINLFLIFLVVNLPSMQKYSLIFMVLTIVIMLFKYARRRSKSEYAQEDDIRDLFPLVKKYIRINRKYLIASILGLSIAIMVISQIILLSNASTGTSYNQILADGNVPMFEFSQYMDGSQRDNVNITTLQAGLYKTFEQSAQEQGIKVQDMLIYYSYNFLMLLDHPSPANKSQPYADTIDLTTQSMNKRLFNIYSQFPSFPTNVTWHPNITILVLSPDIPSYPIANRSQLENPSGLTYTDYQRSQNFTMKYNAVWQLTYQDLDYAASHKYNYFNRNFFGASYILADENVIPSLFNNTNVNLNQDGAQGFIDVNSLQGLKVDAVLQKFQIITDSLYSYLNNQNVAQFNLYSPAQQELQSSPLQNTLIATVLLLISLPMLGIAMYLVYFSLNLVELRKQNLVAIMKIRGISSGQLQVMMMIEAFVASIIASVIGMLVSIPWSQYILSTTKIYGENSSVYLSPQWYWTIPVIGLILAFDLNIGSVLSISSTTVEEGAESEEKKEPFWRRLYLDVIFTVIGVSLWIVVRYVALDQVLYLILLNLALWTLPFLVLGLPLLVSRYYSSFLSIISDFLWIREGNIFALATRNMRKNKFSASKLSVLLMIGMMFSFMAICVPTSFNNWTGESVHYNIGADFRINNLDPTNATQFQILTNRTDISAISQFHSRSVYLYNSFLYNSINIIGINESNFAKAAFWKSSYAQDSLSDLMSILAKGEILVHDAAMKPLGLKIGGDLVVNDPQLSMSEKIGGTFKYWPTLFNYFYGDSSYVSDVNIVMPLSLYQAKFNSSTLNVFAKASPSSNQTKTYEDLGNRYAKFNLDASKAKIYVQSAQVNLETIYQDPVTTLLFSMLNTLLIITILTNIIGVSYFSFTTLAERKREIGVFRAVGMVSRQIFSLLVIESVILVTSSLLIGIIAGSFMASNIFLLIGPAFSSTIPPITLIFPPLLTIGFVVANVILSIFAAAIPARSTATKQTGSILRAE